MGDQYIGEIRMFAGNFAPQGWAFCNGQSLPISENQELFALIGTTYGGDGQTTFGLPDLRGRLAMAPSGTHQFGSAGGTETVTLGIAHLPAHTHTAAANTEPGTALSPEGNFWAAESVKTYGTTGTVAMSASAIDSTGGSQAHSNVMPFQVVSFIIALEGEWPQMP